MKHAVVRAITSVAVALILLAEAHAIETARTITLVRGWSAVWLDVDPVETAGDDAGLPRLVEDVFADPAVTIVARPDVPVGSAEFISDPRRKSFNQDGRWLMWRRNSELGANTLTRIRGNRAYLVYSEAKRTITISVTGEATFHTPEWVPASFNLVGFTFGSSPTFAEFFEAAGDTHPTNEIFRLRPKGEWVTVDPHDQMSSNEAYWVYAALSSAFMGPVRIDIGAGDSLDYGADEGGAVVPDTYTPGTLSLSLAEITFSSPGDVLFHRLRLAKSIPRLRTPPAML